VIVTWQVRQQLSGRSNRPVGVVPGRFCWSVACCRQTPWGVWASVDPPCPPTPSWPPPIAEGGLSSRHLPHWSHTAAAESGKETAAAMQPCAMADS